MVGLDAALVMNTKVWEASGHLDNFTDPLVECQDCKKRFRSDDLKTKSCPECKGKLTKAKQFNLMFKTFIGPAEETANVAYFRPETAQGIFVNFKNVLDTTRRRLPFGIAQIGKAFRNEITPGNFIFRTREFEQMEMQYFVNEKDADKFYNEWKEWTMNWYKQLINKKDNIRWRQHEKDELAHYAKEAWDIEYKTPFGDWNEFAGVHNRGDWDLSRHGEFSGEDMNYTDQDKNKFIPWVQEVSMGADRAVLMFLIDAYTEVETRSGDDDSKHQTEVVLKLHKDLAPIKIAIFPLFKKDPLQDSAQKIFETLSAKWMCQYDQTGSIGKRYRRQDEIGTPYCVTVDFDTLEKDNSVTVRDRDTMEQERVKIDELEKYFEDRL